MKTFVDGPLDGTSVEDRPELSREVGVSVYPTPEGTEMRYFLIDGSSAESLAVLNGGKEILHRYTLSGENYEYKGKW